MTPITVYVESEPRTTTEITVAAAPIARPVPTGGSFLIPQRLDRGVWDQLKAAGAWYLDADTLEDLDMFDSQPGWRYPLAALEILSQCGYTLTIRGETVTDVAALHALFTDAAKDAYRERIKAEQAAAKQAEQERARAAANARQAAGAAYQEWQAEHLAGLVATTVAPPSGGYGPSWGRVYRAEKGTPGAWYDTGDTWHRSEINGSAVYRRDYGNAALWYAPQALVDAWVLAKDDGSIVYARHVLEYHQYGVYGSDIADRLVALRGLAHYLDRARDEEWIITAGATLSREVDVIAHYGIAATPVALKDDRRYHGEPERELTAVIGLAASGRAYNGVAQAADGRWFATTDRWGHGQWRALTSNEATALGLSLELPTVAPAMPEARPLPTAGATEDRNRRFNEIFG